MGHRCKAIGAHLGSMVGVIDQIANLLGDDLWLWWYDKTSLTISHEKCRLPGIKAGDDRFLTTECFNGDQPIIFMDGNKWDDQCPGIQLEQLLVSDPSEKLNAG